MAYTYEALLDQVLPEGRAYLGGPTKAQALAAAPPGFTYWEDGKEYEASEVSTRRVHTRVTVSEPSASANPPCPPAGHCRGNAATLQGELQQHCKGAHTYQGQDINTSCQRQPDHAGCA